MKYTETSKRLQKAIDDAGLLPTELARVAKVSDASISQYLSGKHKPTKKTADKISVVLGVSPLWLMGFDVPMTQARGDPLSGIINLSAPAAHGLPILGEICAGNGIDCQENFEGFFFVDSTIKADYCLRVSGDSMIDAEIYNGDIAFIRKVEQYERGSIYAVLVYGENTASLKRVYDQGDSFLLLPCNNNYEPIICKKCDIVIIGEFIGTFHKKKNATAQGRDILPKEKA